MKKNTLETIKTALTSFGFADADVLAELDAEINRGAEKKAANAAAYEAIHSLVVDNLSDTPVTVTELYEEIKTDLSGTGMSKGQVQYALNNLWQDEIVKIPGKPNTYKKA